MLFGPPRVLRNITIILDALYIGDINLDDGVSIRFISTVKTWK